MIHQMLPPVFLVLATLALSWLVISRLFRRRLPLPPGPAKYPVIGNLLNSPKSYQWIQYARWAVEFDSDIIYLRILGSTHIVLNSFEAANELLHRRSAIYSDRPRQYMAMEIMGQDFNMGLIQYGNRWRTRRRVFWQEFMPARSYHHVPTQTKYARYLLQLLLHSPDNFLNHIRHSLGASVLEITYGIVPRPVNDPIVGLGDKVARRMKDTPIFGAFLVDVIPALRHLPRWMPGTGFHDLGSASRREIAEFRDVPYSYACQSIAEGKVVSSFLSRALAKFSSTSISPEDECVLKDVASIAYEAGSDTTPSAVSSFFVAMLLYPDIQTKAQHELDGHLDRFPELSDRPNLPYTHAVMLEVLRWQPVVPLGLSHAVIMDDEYGGFFIPKNSTVTVNVWAILNDETRFPNPREFDPERFLIDGKVNDQLAEVVMVSFGFGRRICPGRFFAIDSLWITIASVLYAYRIGRAMGNQGRTIIPDIKYEPIHVRQVLPFECAITPRSEKAKKLIEDLELLQY